MGCNFKCFNFILNKTETRLMASADCCSLCDSAAGVDTLEDRLMEVDLLCVLMVDHLVMVVRQKSQSPLLQKVTEHDNDLWQFQRLLPQLLCVLSSFDSNNCTCSSLGSLPSGYCMARAHHIHNEATGLCMTVQKWESPSLGGMRC
jgi:hypothetical protein